MLIGIRKSATEINMSLSFILFVIAQSSHLAQIHYFCHTTDPMTFTQAQKKLTGSFNYEMVGYV